MKRAIIKPVRSVSSEAEMESIDSKPAKNLNGKKKGKASKLPAGFALMHGFAASNVGKRRITVCTGALD